MAAKLAEAEGRLKDSNLLLRTLHWTSPPASSLKGLSVNKHRNGALDKILDNSLIWQRKSAVRGVPIGAGRDPMKLRFWLFKSMPCSATQAGSQFDAYSHPHFVHRTRWAAKSEICPDSRYCPTRH
jgi:hypothetical protein